MWINFIGHKFTWKLFISYHFIIIIFVFNGLKKWENGLKPSSEKPISSKVSKYSVHFTTKIHYDNFNVTDYDYLYFMCLTNKRSRPKTFHWNTNRFSFFPKKITLNLKNKLFIAIVIFFFFESTDSIYVNSIYVYIV